MPREKTRSDKGRPHKYKNTYETRGSAGKENQVIRAFWKKHKMDDIIQLEGKELDKAIDSWFEGYEARQIKRDRNWWYPTIVIPINKARNKRTSVDKGWHL